MDRKKIVFCGVGALGSTAALLCRNLPVDFVYIDFDRVESKNLLSQAYVKLSVGKNKAEALKLQMANFYGLKVEAFPVRLVEANIETLCGKADLLVDCFDNFESRRLLSDFARISTKPLLHGAIAGDGRFGLVRWEERFAPDPEDAAGQATCEGGEHLPLIGQVAAAIARAIQDFLSSGIQRDVMVSLTAVTPTFEPEIAS